MKSETIEEWLKRNNLTEVPKAERGASGIEGYGRRIGFGLYSKRRGVKKPPIDVTKVFLNYAEYSAKKIGQELKRKEQKSKKEMK